LLSIFGEQFALAFRVLIENVPKGLSTSAIKNHRILSSSVIRIIPSTEHAIFELSDRSIYEKCVDQGTLRVDDYVLVIKPYPSLINPEDNKINAKTWYETDMGDLKPDIAPFMSLS
jgi:hypothetical protein